MATYSAPSNTQHGAQSCQQSNVTSLTTPLSRVTHPPQPSPPTQTPLSPADCRWKRGRPVAFSGRAFSSRPARHTAQAIARAISTPSVAVQPCDQGTEAQSRQRCEGLGDTAAADEERVSADGQPYTVPLDDVHAQIDRVVNDDPSSTEQSAIGATVSRPVYLPSSGLEGHNSASAHSTTASSSGGDMADVSDTDYVPTSSDEGHTNSEQDGSEAEDTDEEPGEAHTPLDYQIPEEVLRATMSAPENTKASFWSSNLYRGPEDKQILVHYCKTKEVAERVAKHFVNEKAIGFDIEWRPFSSPKSVKKNVSLIQLACEDRIALFHLALFRESTAAQLMPPTLKAILESPDIYKVGVAVKGDFSRIVKYLDVEPQGVFELSRLHNLVEHFASDPSKVSNKLVGLASQVQQHLQLPLYKGGQLLDDPEDSSNVRSSDWSLPLNRQQIHYAAADAYAGFRLFDVLEEKRKQLKPTPPRPLVCDYDAKPRPKSGVSKPRKKRSRSTKDETVAVVAGEPIAASDQTEELDEEAEEESQTSQDTEEYETAQESLLDSHQVEGEVLGSTEESFESTDESDDDISIDPDLSPNGEELVAATASIQRRIGRINLSRLRGPDPGYPVLPKLGEEDDSLPDEDLVDISNRLDEAKFDSGDETAEVDDEAVEAEEETSVIDQEAAELADESEQVSEPASSTDEFDDSELEEALQDLHTDANGNLIENTPPTPAATQEPQHLITPLHAPPPPSTSPSPEYTLATSWARTYLLSTIPAPGSATPSQRPIRATVSHLRAYHMWAHQHLSMDEIARQLRDPPVAQSTAAGYVLSALWLEGMAYDSEAVRGVLRGLPAALRRGRWRAFAERVGAL